MDAARSKERNGHVSATTLSSCHRHLSLRLYLVSFVQHLVKPTSAVMLANQDVIVVGPRVVLVPYRYI
jgi:hypothetical protein